MTLVLILRLELVVWLFAFFFLSFSATFFSCLVFYTSSAGSLLSSSALAPLDIRAYHCWRVYAHFKGPFWLEDLLIVFGRAWIEESDRAGTRICLLL